LAAVQAHYESLSTMLGQPVAVPENVISDVRCTALARGGSKRRSHYSSSNVDATPNSGVAYDSLSDAYLKDSQLLAAKGGGGSPVQLAS